MNAILDRILNEQEYKDVPKSGRYAKELQRVEQEVNKPLHISEIINIIKNSGKLELFQSSMDGIKKDLIYKSDIHGISHNERVTMYIFAIGLLEGVNDDDLKLLLEAAKYHDIGRENDGVDHEHGKRSAEKIADLETGLTEEEIKILKTMFISHSVKDDKFEDVAKEIGVADIERTRKFSNILKDADALDRVRLPYGGLDAKYLRTESAKTMTLAGYEIYYNYKKISKEIEKERETEAKESGKSKGANMSTFDIENFNVIEDEENYYFFRALNMIDNQDFEDETILDENGKYIKIRTGREKNEEDGRNTKYKADDKISIREVYDKVRTQGHRKDTNCISLSSNANACIVYGRGYYKDKYVMVKVPKKEMGERVFNAGQYMLEEVEKKVNEYISSNNLDDKLIDALEEIDRAKTPDDIRKAIEIRYTSKDVLEPSKAKMKKGITYRSPVARVSNYQALSEEQSLEKNKIIAKLTLLERVNDMEPVVPNTANNDFLVRTIGNAFSAMEQIHYGSIEGEKIFDITSEEMDMMALLQQVQGVDENVLKELKQELAHFVSSGMKLEVPEESALLSEYKVKDDITIEDMYKLTDGKVEYGMANSIVKKMFYLSKAQSKSKQLAILLNEITGNNPKYQEIIKYISENGFSVEPEIITRQSNKGVKLSESVSLDLKAEELELKDKIKELSQEEQISIMESGGLSNIRDIMSSTFSKNQRNEVISRERYYSEAIFSLYDWSKIEIEEFTLEERTNFLQRMQKGYCIELYNKLEEKGISRQEIPTILLNIITRRNDFEIEDDDTPEKIKEKRLKQYDKLIEENIENLRDELSIERVERFLGYYDVPNTELTLRPYQQTAVNKTKEIFEENRFASVILPTGAGKSFVTLELLIEQQKQNEELIKARKRAKRNALFSTTK